MSFWSWMKEGLSKEVNKQAQEMEANRIQRKEHKIQNKENIYQMKLDNKDRIKRNKIEGAAYCPKCKSTSIQYTERRKQLSVGRAVVGGVLTGGVGAAVGAVTSNKYKGQVKCLNCGKQWKM